MDILVQKSREQRYSVAEFSRILIFINKRGRYICIFFFFQSTGTFIAASRYGSATPIPPSVLSRGIGWQVVTNSLMSLCPRHVFVF